MNKEEQEVLAKNDAKKSYFYCFNNKDTANIAAHEKIVLDAKYGFYCCIFAKDIPNANVKEHEKVVLDSRNPLLCYLFARYVNGANIKEHEKVILDSKNLSISFNFVKYVPGANLELFRGILENSVYKKDFNNLIK